MKQTLEQRVGKGHIDKSEMSGGEKLIAYILENENIKYSYEPRLCTEDTYKNYNGREKSYLRLNYPDFNIEDYGFLIEYIGMPDDPKYMEKVRFKMKKYEEMGIQVLYIHRDDIYRQVGENKFIRRDDAYQNVRQLILYMTKNRKSSGTQPTNIEADEFKDYEYKSKRGAA